MTRAWAVLVGGIMLAVVLGTAGMAAWRSVPGPVATSTRGKVATFNDGYADAKRDDCQLGFQRACSWVHGGRP